MRMLFSSLPIYHPFNFFSACFISLTGTYSIMLNSSGEWNVYLVLNLNKETLSFTLNSNVSYRFVCLFVLFVLFANVGIFS